MKLALGCTRIHDYQRKPSHLSFYRALLLQVPDRTKLRLETPVQLSVPIADPLLGYVARTGVPVTIADASLDPRFNPDLVNFYCISLLLLLMNEA